MVRTNAAAADAAVSNAISAIMAMHKIDATAQADGRYSDVPKQTNTTGKSQPARNKLGIVSVTPKDAGPNCWGYVDATGADLIIGTGLNKYSTVVRIVRACAELSDVIGTDMSYGCAAALAAYAVQSRATATATA